MYSCWRSAFFFQAEDGIRDADVTGVQTCALPILLTVGNHSLVSLLTAARCSGSDHSEPAAAPSPLFFIIQMRSEERRVGKECKYWVVPSVKKIKNSG